VEDIIEAEARLVEDVVEAEWLVEGIEAVEQREHAVATGRLVGDSIHEDTVQAERIVEDNEAVGRR
jgi:hypothetical protein